jgi:hypothetical protein
MFDFDAPDTSNTDERSSNFFASFTPGVTAPFVDDGTLVNVFGRLFHAYFDRPWSDLPNTVYRWQGPSIFDVVPIDPEGWDPE